MAIPKKSSRTITVAETRYRWVVSVHDDTVNLVVEAADDPGQRLMAYFQCRDLYVRDANGQWKFVSQQQSIRPSHVRRLILAATQRGWQPFEKGRAPFVLRDAAKVAQTIDADHATGDGTGTYIREVARDFIWSYMSLNLCMNRKMYDRLYDAPQGHRFPVDSDEPTEHGLTFCCYKDSFTPDGALVIGIQCNEFPDIVETYWWVSWG